MQKEILRVFEYFYFFSYSLNFKTIKKYLGVKISDKRLKKELERLVNLKKIAFKRGLYTLGEYSTHKIKSQRFKVVNSKVKLNSLRFRAFIKLISLFSIVKLVGVSGSVAMDNAGQNDDIDLFIISSINRLWTVRFLCIFIAIILGIKRSRLEKNVNNKVCLNLFFDEKELEIPDFKKNYYISHEIIQLKPLINKFNTYEIFLYRNRWVCDIFPNVKIKKIRQDPISRPSTTITTFSRMTPIVDFIENFLKKIQLYLINKHKTKEIITNSQLWFFPEDFEDKLPEFARKKLN